MQQEVSTQSSPSDLTASEALELMDRGTLTSEALVAANLATIEAREAEVGAWIYLAPEAALEAARASDQARRDGHAIGPLHGLPVAVKDIIDTAEMPTENGTRVHAGRQPREDAAVVAQLQAAGAIVLGKTVTTELAAFGPGKTRNPHDPARTPGGSSSGSAAAVASHMVALALGTQTAGSILRPASFCGVYGLKPTFGLISRRGCLTQSPPLDTIGPMARSVEDLARLAEALSAYDPRDPASWPRAGSGLLAQTMTGKVPPLRLAVLDLPVWGEADAAAQSTFDGFVAGNPAVAGRIRLVDRFADLWAWQKIIQWGDIATHFTPLFEGRMEEASEKLQGMMAVGGRYLAVEYNRARLQHGRIAAHLEEALGENDAFLTLSAPGIAPEGLSVTGDPVFNSLATFAGLPAVSLPLLEVDGLPLGIQLIGRRREDGRLLNAARRLVHATGA